MTAGGEFRNAFTKRFLSLIAELENLVHRHGYLRVFAGVVPLLGIAGLLGQLLGIAWLRTTIATILALLFLLASAIAFAGTEALRARNRKNIELLHEYADALYTASPVVVREWRQTVTIERNGDADIKRELILEAASNGVPRHLAVNLVYYGSSPLTERDKRRIECTALHANGRDPRNATRANATSTWATSRNKRPKLNVYVHLGNVVEAGDVVTVRWRWPGYSADLMNGREPETFDVYFMHKVAKFEHKVIFRGAAADNSFMTRNSGAPNLKREDLGTDVVIKFSQKNPMAFQYYAFIADFR
ncbi:hypothetical protein [Amycolatopsis sp. NPDC059657]|uniref:hypothetical protein n=1 Tax=Amycolatopsis sp. NPDC059657 TaxID=3346899 RepID=UPI003671B9FB